MNFNPLPEEQQNPELISRLQEMHQMLPEDRESLTRIQARLLENAAMLQSQNVAPPHSKDVGQYSNGVIFSQPPVRFRPQRRWLHHLNLIAAVFVVLLITGAAVSVFFLVKGKNQIGGINQITSTPQSTAVATSLHTLPGSGTILNNGINGGGVYMVSEQVGWAMRPGASNIVLDGPVFRTIDGGKSWKQVALPRKPSGQTFEVHVFDEKMVLLLPIQPSVGYLLYFYSSIDGGGTWQRYDWPVTPEITQDGTGMFDTTFLDRMHGWVRVMPKIKKDGGMLVFGVQKLFRTDDGGKTWQYVASLPLKSGSVNLVFTNYQTGWFIAASENGYEGFPGSLFMTKDGGHTWQQHALPAVLQTAKKPYYLSSLTFFNERDGYLFVVFIDGTSDPRIHLATTHDGGNTWSMGNAVISAGETTTVVDDTHLLVAKYDNDTQHYIYSLLMLKNGQWVPASNKIPAKGEECMGFLSSQKGMVLQSVTGNGVDVYSTDDGGKSWQKIGALPDVFLQ